MHCRILPIVTPDYEASSWLQFTGRRLVDGDPVSYTAFVSAYRCLAALTDYSLDTAGPWSSITAEDVLDVYHDYCLWFNATLFETSKPSPFLPMTMDNLSALSQRRIVALAEFGGAAREEYPVFQHMHRKICEAARATHVKRRAYTVDDVYSAPDHDSTWQGAIHSV